MIQQLGNALTFYAQFTESKVGKTGLTVTVDVYENGTAIVTDGSATEVGTSGIYQYTLASGSVDAAGQYICLFKTATTTVDLQQIPALWVVGTTWVERLTTALNLLATATNLATVDTVVDGIAAALTEKLDAAITSRLAAGTIAADVTAVKAKTDTIPVSPAAVGSAMTLHADYDAAKTAASATNLATVDTVVDGIAATVAEKLDETVSSRASLAEVQAAIAALGTTITINSNDLPAEANYTTTRDSWITRTESVTGLITVDAEYRHVIKRGGTVVLNQEVVPTQGATAYTFALAFAAPASEGEYVWAIEERLEVVEGETTTAQYRPLVEGSLSVVKDVVTPAEWVEVVP